MAKQYKKPPLEIQPTTLWDYPSQHYGEGMQGDKNYIGATPSYIIWNLLKRYTEEGQLVIDPMCGSGTTLDVARDLNRRALGYDVNPTRKDIFRVDARKLPLEDGKADFVFIDPPYSTHVDYSDDPRCIGKLSAQGKEYYDSMRQVISEIHRVLRPERHMGLYVSDSFEKGKGFFPIGFELFAIMREFFTPVDIISVIRHNRTLDMGNYRAAAEEGNFFLRGFNYLFIMYKEKDTKPAAPKATRQKARTGRSAKKKAYWNSKYKPVTPKPAKSAKSNEQNAQKAKSNSKGNMAPSPNAQGNAKSFSKSDTNKKNYGKNKVRKRNK